MDVDDSLEVLGLLSVTWYMICAMWWYGSLLPGCRNT